MRVLRTMDSPPLPETLIFGCDKTLVLHSEGHARRGPPNFGYRLDDVVLRSGVKFFVTGDRSTCNGDVASQSILIGSP